MSLKFSYTLLAPIYDSIVGSATQAMRENSIKRLPQEQTLNVLINGIGTGLDLPFLPPQHHYTATDITPAMLDKCKSRAENSTLEMKLELADAMQLPYADNQFDIVLMNLILAVVPQPSLALQEASRVVKPGGKILIMDKFIRTGQWALTRRLMSVFMRHIATRTDVIFEELLEQCPELQLLKDEPSLMNGWFRLIDLEKINSEN